MAELRASRESVRFIWEQAESRIESQLRQADALDTKAGILVGLHAVAAGILASTLPGFSRASALIATAVIAALLTSGVLAFLAFRSQDYDRSPRPEELSRFVSWDEDEVRFRFLSTSSGRSKRIAPSFGARRGS